MAKYTAIQKARDIYADFANNGAELQFISGKWFKKFDNGTWGEEITNIKRLLIETYPHVFDDLNDIERVLDAYIAMYGETGTWYPSALVQAAYGFEKYETDPKELCFPLTPQQLKIINLLITGTEEIMFIVTGCGGSGKSTFLNIIRQIFSNDCSACPISDLSGFNLSEALSRRLIASDEISADDLDNKTLKMIISRQEMQINPKMAKPYQIKCQSALFYCCNIPPRIDLADTGLLRRIVYYEMDTPIKSPDLSLRQKHWNEMDIINIIRHALRVDMTNWRKDFEEQTHYYLLKNNSVYILRNANTYQDYVYLCNKKGLKPYSEPNWQTVYQLIEEWNMKGARQQPEQVFVPLAADEELPF